MQDIGKIVKVTARGVRGVASAVGAAVSATAQASRWVGRHVGRARWRGGKGNVGMMRLLDLHAISCAGDTLITIGLAGTIFFAVPVGEARGQVALYLLVTMVPFALLAPVVGPLLDRFRHGRRFALAATMLGRAFLAWVIADNLFGFGLYPAAFGVLILSRAYGVARSAAVPRLLPRGLGLSQAGARASVYGTVAGTVVAPLGAAAFWFGPQWPLRVASVIFLAGVVVALSLPPKADSDPPEVPPKTFQLPWRHRVENGEPVLSGRLVRNALAGSAAMRMLYGFLLLSLAFAIRGGEVSTEFLGISLNEETALGLTGGSMALGTFAATAIGSGLRIRRPVRLQAIWFVVLAGMGLWATVRFTLATIVLFCLMTAVASGLAKLAVDASIQERISEQVRASAFAHAETLLMLAWVAGGAAGLVPLDGRVGVALAALAALATAVRGCVVAWRMRDEVPLGHPTRQATAGKPSVAGTLPRKTSPAAATPSGSDDVPAGYHLFRPSSPEQGIFGPSSPGQGIGDPRSGA